MESNSPGPQLLSYVDRYHSTGAPDDFLLVKRAISEASDSDKDALRKHLAKGSNLSNSDGKGVSVDPRVASDVALSQVVEDYSELNPPVAPGEERLASDLEKESEGIVLEMLRERWGESIRVSALRPGILETGVDGKACLCLLQMAGVKIDTKSEELYIKKGTFEEGKTNLGTGNKDGVIVNLDFSDDKNQYEVDETVIIDNHAPNSNSGSSSAERLYSVLAHLGMIEKNPSLDKFVKFISAVEDFDYDEYGDYFENSSQNLLGLIKFVPQEKMGKVIELLNQIDSPASDLKAGKTDQEFDKFLFDLGVIRARNPRRDEEPYEFVSATEIRTANGALVKSNNHFVERTNSVKLSLDAIHEMEAPDEGFSFDSEKFGKVLVDTGVEAKSKSGETYYVNRVKLSAEAAYAAGYDTYIRWAGRSNSFFISSKKGFPEDFSLGSGTMVRGKMWVSEVNPEVGLDFNLIDLLEKVSNDDYKYTGELDKFLIEEEFGTRRIDLGDIDEKSTEFWHKIKTDNEKKYFENAIDDFAKVGLITTGYSSKDRVLDELRMAAFVKLAEEKGYEVGDFYFYKITGMATAEIKGKTPPVPMTKELIKEEVSRASEFMEEGSEWQVLSSQEIGDVEGKATIYVWRNEREKTDKNSGSGDYELNSKNKYFIKSGIGSTSYASRIILEVVEPNKSKYEIDMPLRTLFYGLRPKSAKGWNKEIMDGVLDSSHSLAQEKSKELKFHRSVEEKKKEIDNEHRDNPAVGEATELEIKNIDEVGEDFWDTAVRNHSKELIANEKSRILKMLKNLASNGEFVYSLGKDISNEDLLKKSNQLAGIFVLAKDNGISLEPYIYYPETGYAVAKVKRVTETSRGERPSFVDDAATKEDKGFSKKPETDEEYQERVLNGDITEHDYFKTISKQDRNYEVGVSTEIGESSFENGILYLGSEHGILEIGPGVSRTWLNGGINGENRTLTVRTIREIDHDSKEKHYEITFVEESYAKARSLADWSRLFGRSWPSEMIDGR